jgi:dihydrofolate reductase
MRKIVLLMHVTLDGFVAGPNGEMDWIHVDDEIFEYPGKLTADADTALYGRVTYQMMESYWPTAGDDPNASKHDIEHATWYNEVEKVVLSNTLQGQNSNNIKIINGDVAAQIKELKQQNGKNILIIGSPSAVHVLLEHDLLDDFWLFVNPVLLGQGIPLFKNVKAVTKLKLVANTTFTSGVICTHYTKA